MNISAELTLHASSYIAFEKKNLRIHRDVAGKIWFRKVIRLRL